MIPNLRSASTAAAVSTAANLAAEQWLCDATTGRLLRPATAEEIEAQGRAVAAGLDPEATITVDGERCTVDAIQNPPCRNERRELAAMLADAEAVAEGTDREILATCLGRFASSLRGAAWANERARREGYRLAAIAREASDRLYGLKPAA